MIRTNLKYADTRIVFREIPNEITLAINITNCPCHCKGCHSSYLAEDFGTPLTDLELGWLICSNDGITCVSFMGGDNSPEDIVKLARVIKEKYPSLKVAWYSGRDKISDCVSRNLKYFDYIKYGPYIEERGPLNNSNTNQIMLAKGYILNKMSAYSDEWYDITDKFWKKNESKGN